LKKLNLSYNFATTEDLILVLESCNELEKLEFISNIKFNENLIETLNKKMLISNYPLKCFAFSFQINQEFNVIKDIFFQKWSNNLHVKFRKANIVELFI
jgi:hypothetical protein